MVKIKEKNPLSRSLSLNVKEPYKSSNLRNMSDKYNHRFFGPPFPSSEMNQGFPVHFNIFSRASAKAECDLSSLYSMFLCVE